MALGCRKPRLPPAHAAGARGMRVIAKTQRQEPRRAWRSVCAAACTTLLALPASASEEGLVLVPDLRPFGMLVQLLVLFVVLVYPVNAFVIRPLLRILAERDKQITGTRARAARLAEDARGIAERYQNSIRKVREEAEGGRRERIEQTRVEMLETTAAARTDAEGEIERARAELAGSLESAREILRTQAQDLAREAASRVLGRAL